VLTGGEQQEQRWREAVDDRYGTLAELVRTSVENELGGYHDAPETEVTPGDSKQMGDVLTAVRQVQSTLEEMDGRLRHLERQADTSGPMYNLERVVLELLPVQELEHIPDPFLPEKYGINCVTAKNLAQRIGADESDIRDALEHLHATITSLVDKETGPDGTDYFWKVE
jgi:hypothetical protein